MRLVYGIPVLHTEWKEQNCSPPQFQFYHIKYNQYNFNFSS